MRCAVTRTGRLNGWLLSVVGVGAAVLAAGSRGTCMRVASNRSTEAVRRKSRVGDQSSATSSASSHAPAASRTSTRSVANH